MRRAVHPHPARIDAFGRQQRVDAVDVGGGKTEPAAAAFTVNYRAANAIGACQHGPDLIHLPGRHQPADQRAGDDPAADLQGLDGLHLDAGLIAELPHQLDGAVSIVAEEEIAAFDQPPRPQSPPHYPVEELPGFHVQECPVGRIGQHGVGPQPAEQLGLQFGPAERGRGLLGVKNAGRMGVEGEHQRRPTHLPGHGQQPLDDPGMAAMDAIEIPDGHGPAAIGVRQTVKVAVQIHGSLVRRNKADGGGRAQTARWCRNPNFMLLWLFGNPATLWHVG